MRKVTQSTALACTFLICTLELLATCAAQQLLFPTALYPGDTIQVVAPARPLSRAAMGRARHRLEAMGFRVKMAAEVFRTDGYLAGSDEQRAAELMAAFRDPSVNAIFPGTGGFGTTRLLDRLDYAEIRRNPKILIGFSDITGLHLAIHRRAGLVTFHSPNTDGGFGRLSDMTEYSHTWFSRALLAEFYPESAGGRLGYLIPATISQAADRLADGAPDRPPRVLVGGKARGRLVGGNLSLIAALTGTPYEIETDGRVLFLEDIGEAPYRVDRMLSTLRLAGKLDDLAAIVLGSFTRRGDEDTSDEQVTIDSVLRGYFESLGVPVLAGFPVGHQPWNATLPLGVLCEVDAEAGTIRLLENPVRLRLSTERDPC